MVKSELILHIANKFRQLPEKDIEICVNQILELICETLEKNQRVEIRSFGSFCLHKRLSRRAHNPRTGEKLITVQKHAIYFKPGKEMKDRVNQFS
jgi:integration host factor subunit beta